MKHAHGGPTLALLGCQDGWLHAIDIASGALVWRLDLGGGIHADPVVTGSLAFLPIDRGGARGSYDTEGELRVLVVVDLVARKVLARHQANGRWSRRLVVTDKLAIAGDDTRLVAFHRSDGRQVWETKLPQHLAATPVLIGDTLWLPFNRPQHGRLSAAQPTELLILNARTGERVAKHSRGGIVDGGDKWIRRGSILVSAGHALTGYQIALPQ